MTPISYDNVKDHSLELKSFYNRKRLKSEEIDNLTPMNIDSSPFHFEYVNQER
jgi:hypothetical protein